MNFLLMLIVVMSAMSSDLFAEKSYKSLLVKCSNEDNILVSGNWLESNQDVLAFDKEVVKKGMITAASQTDLDSVIDNNNAYLIKFYKAKIRGKKLDKLSLPNLRIEKSNAQSVRLKRKKLERVVLEAVNLKRADFHGSQLHNVEANNVDLQEADLHGAILEGIWQAINFDHANLQNARLSGTYQDVSFNHANLRNIKIADNTNLRGAKNLNLSLETIQEAESRGCKFGPWTKFKAKVRK